MHAFINYQWGNFFRTNMDGEKISAMDFRTGSWQERGEDKDKRR